MRAVVLLLFGVAPSTPMACEAIQSPPSLTLNDCPAHPCSAYRQPGAPPKCGDAGFCSVATQRTGLVLLVALPTDSFFAPGRTFAIPFEQDNAPTTSSPQCMTMPSCVFLPDVGVVRGTYLITPRAQELVQWNLGNQGDITSLPVQATYHLLWPAGQSMVSAESLGLPVAPVRAVTIGAVGELAFPGPAMAPAVEFQTYLQPGTYERTLVPTPPIGRFAPEVKTVAVAKGLFLDKDNVEAFDFTRETGGALTIPTFDITRADGLDGWTAYLRDGSRRIISNVSALSGMTTKGVLLATRHVQQGVDALTNAELVVAPPAGLPVPTGIFAPIGQVLPAAETYPPLPAPVTVQGNIEREDHTPVAAELVFEALAIADAEGRLNSSNFEFVGHAQARSALSAPSSYSVELPPGQYRLSVRPLDAASQVTVVPFRVDAGNAGAAGPNIVVGARRTVLGKALVADGRSLWGGAVEAVPTACAPPDGSSPWCFPRWASTSTAADGSFRLALDPGKYQLRVRPADGSGLPWVQTPLLVGPADLPVTLPIVTVPAPMFVGRKLVDPAANPIVHAVVRVFQMPASGPAVELGRAITNETGQYDMYIAPPLQ